MELGVHIESRYSITMYNRMAKTFSYDVTLIKVTATYMYTFSQYPHIGRDKLYATSTD